MRKMITSARMSNFSIGDVAALSCGNCYLIFCINTGRLNAEKMDSIF